MKKVKDRFSKQADAYKKYRPTYPQALYNEILSLVFARDACWDCGTGNGQVAVKLSPYFKKIYATDISENQLSRAPKKENISYSVRRAGHTNFQENTFDLVTVAQAVHWFDIIAFDQEIQRVVKNNGLVYIWGYGLPQVNGVIDAILDDFYRGVVGPYWDKERRHIENGYASIALNFSEIKLRTKHCITVHWTLKDVLGYLNSWSSVQNFIAREGRNPVDNMFEKLGNHWKKETIEEVEFPIFTRVGRIEK